MKKKLILFNALIVTAALFLMFALGLLVTRNNNYEQAKTNIAQITAAYALNYSPEEYYADTAADGVRLTVVDKNGVVLADSSESDVSAMENHINREEIQAAANGAPKAVMRESGTLGVKMMYYALKIEIDGEGNMITDGSEAESYVFVRTAVAVETLNSYALKTVPLMLLILFVALCAAVLAGIGFSDKALKPLKTVKASLSEINQGNFVNIPPTTGDENINKMLVDINDISQRLHETITVLDTEKNKLDYILNNVSDGIVAFDGEGNVLSANANALSVFGLNENVIGKDVYALTSDESFVKSVSLCVDSAEDGIFEFGKGGKHFLCTVRNTKGETAASDRRGALSEPSDKTDAFKQKSSNDALIVLVMSDVTAAKNSEEQRSQFFENAGHELKTPLTSIRGFNEMLMLKNKDASLSGYIEKTARETERMQELLDDMLKLSRLEHTESPDEIQKEETDAFETARLVCDNLQKEASERGVSLRAEGCGCVFANRQHIYELMKNLAENAVKYNKEGGYALISVREVKNGTIIQVSDNGIGVDAKHQSRIFERFYRVEQSRSRETGGTGLGLAIVKHIAELYGAELKLSSKTNEGTKITVFFKKRA
jgi:two-component system phosphate regulon sensor histidine kinase PhoR